MQETVQELLQAEQEWEMKEKVFLPVGVMV